MFKRYSVNAEVTFEPTVGGDPIFATIRVHVQAMSLAIALTLAEIQFKRISSQFEIFSIEVE